LIEGDKKIKEIANILGYTDEFYFSRIFKKTEGISPSEYHNKNTKTNHFNRKLYAPMILVNLAVALIPIGNALGAPPSQTAWLVSALYFTTAIGQPVVGKLIDTFGPKLLYLIGTALVGIASLVAF
jgi:hypothetical protein